MTKPPDRTPLDTCSFYQPQSFAWDQTEYFNSYEIQFSLTEGFRSGSNARPQRLRAIAPSTPGRKSFFCRRTITGNVHFLEGCGNKIQADVLSDVFSMLMEPCRPVGVPTITPTSRNALPTLSWKHYCSNKFKVTFWKISQTEKKISLSYTVKDPTDIGDLFTKELTPNQWKSIRKLVGDESGRAISWSVESWDGLKRYVESEAMSFVLTD